ncbi:MAG: hypothetical protein V1652_03375 [bacterium]
MNVIPAINAISVHDAEEKISIAKSFSRAIHFDFADGTFTQNTLWGTSYDIACLCKKYPDIFFEVHLMTRTPFLYTHELLSAGVGRIIVHAEVGDFDDIKEDIQINIEKYMISFLPQTSIDTMRPFFSLVQNYQILSVDPGFSGQFFQNHVLEKIRFLRGYLPNATIEVDGGVNEKTAVMIKHAGADTIVSASYIFDNISPEKAFKRLVGIMARNGDSISEYEEKA